MIIIVEMGMYLNRVTLGTLLLLLLFKYEIVRINRKRIDPFGAPV